MVVLLLAEKSRDLQEIQAVFRAATTLGCETNNLEEAALQLHLLILGSVI